MNQSFVRRAGMALGLWRLLRYQSRLCRWLPITVAHAREQIPANEVGAARWLGNIRIGRCSHHALFIPPGFHTTYRFVAPPHSRLVAWCGIASDGLPDGHGVEFVATARNEGSPRELTARLRLTPGRAPGDRRWRKLVLELQNREIQQIEVTLAIQMESNGRAVKPSGIWGEPRLEWPRPAGELRAALQAAGRLVRRGRLMAAARTLHGRLSERSYSFLY